MQHTYLTNDIHPYSPQDYDAPLQHTSLPAFSDANYFTKPQGPYDEAARIPSYNTPLFAPPPQETDLTTGPKFYFQQNEVPRSYGTNEQAARPFEPDNPTDPQLAQPPTTKQKQKYKCSVKQGCEKTFDFLSLLRKHEATHTRPEICQYCSKKFASKTDRQRHINNVHLSNPSSAFAYKCRYGSCASKSKLYLRPDNFKTHLKRKHKPQTDADEDAFYAQAEKDCRVSVNQSSMQQHKPMSMANEAEAEQVEESRNGYSNKPAWEESHHRGLGHPENPYGQGLAPTQPTNFHTMETTPRMLENEFLQIPGTHTGYAPNVGAPTTMAHSEAPVEAATILASLRDQTYNNGMEQSFTGLLADGADNEQNAIPIDPAMTVGMSDAPRSNTWPQPTYTDEVMAEPESERPLGEEAAVNGRTSPTRLRTSPMTTRPISKRSTGQSSTSGVSKAGVSKPSANTQKASGKSTKRIKCTYEFCQSTFQKPRDLRKHLTRHIKPYECTQPGCEGVFGSKNDWVRHEKSQHFRLEYWTCPLKDLDAGKNHYAVKYLSSKCSTIFFRKESLQQHLRGRHQESLNVVIAVLENPEQAYPPKGLVPNAPYDNNLENEIVKKSFKQKKDDDPFWCGFCEKEINEKGSVRYEHIGRHFDQMKKEEVVKKSWVPKPGALQDYFLNEPTQPDESRRDISGNSMC